MAGGDLLIIAPAGSLADLSRLPLGDLTPRRERNDLLLTLDDGRTLRLVNACAESQFDILLPDGRRQGGGDLLARAAGEAAKPSSPSASAAGADAVSGNESRPRRKLSIAERLGHAPAPPSASPPAAAAPPARPAPPPAPPPRRPTPAPSDESTDDLKQRLLRKLSGTLDPEPEAPAAPPADPPPLPVTPPPEPQGRLRLRDDRAEIDERGGPTNRAPGTAAPPARTAKPAESAARRAPERSRAPRPASAAPSGLDPLSSGDPEAIARRIPGEATDGDILGIDALLVTPERGTDFTPLGGSAFNPVTVDRVDPVGPAETAPARNSETVRSEPAPAAASGDARAPRPFAMPAPVSLGAVAGLGQVDLTHEKVDMLDLTAEAVAALAGPAAALVVTGTRDHQVRLRGDWRAQGERRRENGHFAVYALGPAEVSVQLGVPVSVRRA